jgi:hypothetical protein
LAVGNVAMKSTNGALPSGHQPSLATGSFLAPHLAVRAPLDQDIVTKLEGHLAA